MSLIENFRYRLYVCNDGKDGVLMVPHTCRVSVMHVSGAENGTSRHELIESMNSADKNTLSTMDSIYVYTRALDVNAETGEKTVPTNKGRDSQPSPVCILTHESFFLVLPTHVKTDIGLMLAEKNLDQLYVTFIDADDHCSTKCSVTHTDIPGTFVLNKSDFPLLHSPPASPLSFLLN